MKTIRPASFEVNRPVDNWRFIVLSFMAWGGVFGFGAWILARQISKIMPAASSFTFETAKLLVVGAFGLMLGIHFLRTKVLRHTPEYSVKFLALPVLIILLELAIYWVLRL